MAGIADTRRAKAGRLAQCLAVGIGGAMLAGLALPQLGVPVSTSLARGIITTTLGALIPLAVLTGWRKAKIQWPTRLFLCAAALRSAAVLSLINAALIMISLKLASQAVISASTVTVSTVVAAIFAMAALLALRPVDWLNSRGGTRRPDSCLVSSFNSQMNIP